MKTKIINLYEYAELSPTAKEKALNDWNEHNHDPFMQSHMINLLKEALEERGIKYDTDSIDVRYSLSNCQGDWFMFIGELEWGKYTVYIKHNSGHYYHSNTANIEIHEGKDGDGLGYYNEDDYKKLYEEFYDIYEEICKKMERAGHEHVEYITSEESFMGACEANEYTFLEDGTMENV